MKIICGFSSIGDYFDRGFFSHGRAQYVCKLNRAENNWLSALGQYYITEKDLADWFHMLQKA